MRLLGLLLAVALGMAGESVSPLFFIQDSPDRYLIRVPGMTAAFTPQGVEFQEVQRSSRRRHLPGGVSADLHGLEPMGSANRNSAKTSTVADRLTDTPADPLCESLCGNRSDLLRLKRTHQVRYTVAPGAAPG